MLRLLKLEFSGIGRFVDKQTITFESLGRLIQVDGINNNTGGSSGAGKSTIFKAIEFLLGLNNISNSVLESRYAKSGIHVVGHFDFDGEPLVITRNKKLTIEYKGEITSGSSKLSEEKLDSILGLPRDLFRQIIHKRQKEGGFFLQFTPKEAREFLATLVGLSHLKDKTDLIQERIGKEKSNKDRLEVQISSFERSLDALKGTINGLSIPSQCHHTPDSLLVLKRQIDSLRQEYQSINDSCDFKIKEKESNRPSLLNQVTVTDAIIELERRIQEIQEALKEEVSLEQKRRMLVVSEISDLKTLKNQKETILINASKALDTRKLTEHALLKIRSSICPTCHQSWANDSSKNREIELVSEIDKLDLIINQANSIGQDLIDIDQKLLKLSGLQGEILSDRRKELSNTAFALEDLLKVERLKLKEANLNVSEENNRLLNNHRSEIRILEMDKSLTLDPKLYEINTLSRNLDIWSTEYKNYIQNERSRQENLNSVTETISKVESDLAIARSDLLKITEDLQALEELKTSIKVFVSSSFEDALDQISESASSIIRHIPNMANATIQLESQKETASGTVKEEVNAIISMDGEIGIPIKSLSGGEASAVDLAIDLAVIDFMELKTGKGADFFILDEPFNGLDTISVEMALEVLKNSSTGKRIIVVDHNPIIKESLPDKIIVIRDGDTSKIKS